MPNYQLEHVSFEATDNVVLPGLLFTPHEKTDRVVIYLHGMGDNGVFYKSDLINELAAKLTGQGITLLAFNNRGAHGSKQLKIDDDSLPESERYLQAGTNYELIADCVKDIDGAVRRLREAGFQTFFLLGHSTGANKICVYNDLSPENPFSAYVLSGPGDDGGLNYQSLGKDTFEAAIRTAREIISDNRPLAVMPEASGMYPFSAQSALDILDPNGHYNVFPYYEAVTGRLGSKVLFKEYSAIRIPRLVLIGEYDGSVSTAGSPAAALDILKSHTNPAAHKHNEFTIIPGAEHSFGGYEAAYAEAVASWLAQQQLA